MTYSASWAWQHGYDPATCTHCSGPLDLLGPVDVAAAAACDLDPLDAWRVPSTPPTPSMSPWFVELYFQTPVQAEYIVVFEGNGTTPFVTGMMLIDINQGYSDGYSMSSRPANRTPACQPFNFSLSAFPPPEQLTQGVRLFMAHDGAQALQGALLGGNALMPPPPAPAPAAPAAPALPPPLPLHQLLDGPQPCAQWHDAGHGSSAGRGQRRRWVALHA